MATLFEKYRSEIKQWGWKGIVQDALANTEKVGDIVIGSDYIGSFLQPSGKYYTPWANSNLTDCPQCKGTGTTKKKYPCPMCKGEGRRHYEDWMNPGIKTVHYYDPTTNTFTCNVCNGRKNIEKTCSRCGGLGSHEAYQDQEYWKALDSVAAEYGGWVAEGEGDPTDMFFHMEVTDENTN